MLAVDSIEAWRKMCLATEGKGRCVLKQPERGEVRVATQVFDWNKTMEKWTRWIGRALKRAMTTLPTGL
jgi:hypothetical protein